MRACGRVTPNMMPGYCTEGDPVHEGLRRRQHQKCRPRRSQRLRQDPARVRHPRRRRHDQPLRQGRRRHDRHRLTTKRKSPASTRCRRASPTPSGTSRRSTCIDTPGIGNFLADARAALHVADAALVVVDAVAGVDGADREGLGGGRRSSGCRAWSCSTASIASAPASSARWRRCAKSCNRTVIPIQLPIGEEKSFSGVVDLVTKKAFLFQTDESGKFTEAPVPADMTAAVDAAREALIEMVAENDEKLMEKFFEAGTLTDDELVAGLRSATLAGKLFPLVCTSALLNIGVPQLLDADRRLPAVAGRPAVQGHRQGRRRSRARRGREGAAPRRSSGRRSPIRSPAASRCSASCPASLKADSTVHNKTKDAPGAARPPDAAAGQDADATCRRSRPAISARSRS